MPVDFHISKSRLLPRKKLILLIFVPIGFAEAIPEVCWQTMKQVSNGAEIDLILTKGVKTIIIALVKEEYPITKKAMVKPLRLFIEEMAR